MDWTDGHVLQVRAVGSLVLDVRLREECKLSEKSPSASCTQPSIRIERNARVKRIP